MDDGGSEGWRREWGMTQGVREDGGEKEYGGRRDEWRVKKEGEDKLLLKQDYTMFVFLYYADFQLPEVGDKYETE